MDILKKIFSSYKTMIILLSLYAIIMAAATWLEKTFGTTLAKVAVYYSPLFILLQLLLVVNFLVVAVSRHLLKIKRWGMFFIHISFIVILAGAMITHIFGKEGVMHLREGETSALMSMQTNRGHSTLTLPFQVELVKFTLTRYPGSMSPSSFESELLVHVDGQVRRELVYMNNVLDIKGYRFFQASYDTDEKGTILSINQDVAGRTVTYAGYFMLLIGGIGSLVGKNGRLRNLFKKLNNRKASLNDKFSTHKQTVLHILILLLLLPCTSMAADTSQSMSDAVQQFTVPTEHTGKFGALPVQSNSGRIMPLNTLASEILRKVHHDTQFGTLDPDRFLLGLLAAPEMWVHVPLISYSNDAIAEFFDLPDKQCSYIDLFRPDGTYKLQEKIEEAYHKAPAERTAIDKEIIKLDEKANIMHQLFAHQLIRLFPRPGDPNHKWFAPGDELSGFGSQDSLFVVNTFNSYLTEVREALKSGDWSKSDKVLETISSYQTAKNNVPGFDSKKIDIELRYNNMDIFGWCRSAYFILGGITLIFAFISIFSDKSGFKWIFRLFIVLILIVFLFQMTGMAMRWKIAGYAPWSNSYETMIFMAWAMVCAGILFSRRSPITLALGTLFAGIILFVSGLNWMDPQINPLAPVLKSPWLMIHVAVLMSAYGLFGISFLLGLVNLFIMALARKDKLELYVGPVRELSIVNEIILLIGVILMSLGTFMGAVWANESWGRYWGWDPKETWALITMIVYVMVTHLHLLRKQYNLWLFNLCSVLAFSSVLMTYFGVNYFLSGMHSYGQSDLMHGMQLYILGALGFITLLAVFARRAKNAL
ncbi:MAG: cytochrome c biogenesis protein CcsA [Tannerella sp.]|jgi:cytochrome c-type biogenesis protein CcsB|nr:cytochrome c biogenesis protein CcsA [Tannerella sp.]